MLISTLAEAGEDVWECGANPQSDWIKGNCTILNFKEDIERELMTLVSLV